MSLIRTALAVGDTARVSKAFSENDLRKYADLVGDFNPLHFDEQYVLGSRFGSKIVHGMLPIGLISSILGTRMPGPGTIYMRQEVNFLAPLYINENVTAFVEVAEILSGGRKVRFITWCSKDDGTVVLKGEAIVLVPV